MAGKCKNCGQDIPMPEWVKAGALLRDQDGNAFLVGDSDAREDVIWLLVQPSQDENGQWPTRGSYEYWTERATFDGKGPRKFQPITNPNGDPYLAEDLINYT